MVIVSVVADIVNFDIVVVIGIVVTVVIVMVIAMVIHMHVGRSCTEVQEAINNLSVIKHIVKHQLNDYSNQQTKSANKRLDTVSRSLWSL